MGDDVRPLKLLVVGDSPTVETGFGRVTQNLCARWHALGAQVDVWGINYAGWPHELPYRIYPAAMGDLAGWSSVSRFEALLERMTHGKYDAVWMIQDVFQFARAKFPEALRQVTTKSKTRTVYYFPADSGWDPEWSLFLESVDVPVAYTEQGRQVALAAYKASGGRVDRMAARLRAIPHGVDAAVYHPLPAGERRAARRELFQPSDWAEGKLLMVNVNANQQRKDPGASLMVLRHLLDLGVPARLVMHMPRRSSDKGFDLEAVGAQLGLPHGQDWMHTDGLHQLNHRIAGQASLNRMYNAADLLLTTTRGEGWGLSLTEAMSAGCPIAAPSHTSCAEIMEQADRAGVDCIRLPLGQSDVLPRDNSRLRPTVDARGAAERIARQYRELMSRDYRAGLPPALEQAWSWDRIAREWWSILHEQQAMPSSGRDTADPAPAG